MLTINNVLINRIESQSLYEKLSTLPTIGDRLKFLRKDYLKNRTYYNSKIWGE